MVGVGIVKFLQKYSYGGFEDNPNQIFSDLVKEKNEGSI